MTGGARDAVRTGAVALGSGLGAMCRWWLGTVADGAGWHPAASLLAVNAIGSFAIGLFSRCDWSGGGRLATPRGELVRDACMSGFCGGFTAFSLFNADVLRIAEHAGTAAAGAFVGVSVALWIAGVWLGRAMGRRIRQG